MDAPLNLADIRSEIDALDADLRALLLKRADLVAQVAASKAQSGDGGVLASRARSGTNARAAGLAGGKCIAFGKSRGARDLA